MCASRCCRSLLAYPADGISKLDKLRQLSFASVSMSAEQCFTAYGGFLLLDRSGVVVAVQAVVLTDALAPVEDVIMFSKPNTWRGEFTKLLEKSRLSHVTFPSLLRNGARQFRWIAPKEQLELEQDRWMPSPTGAFLYLRDNEDPPLYFSVVLNTSPDTQPPTLKGRGTD